MTQLEEELQAQLKGARRKVLERVVIDKLKAAGASTKAAPAIVDHIVGGSEIEFLWTDGDDDDADTQHHHIELTDEDFVEFERRYRQFIDVGLPEVVRKTVERSGLSLAKELKRSWPAQHQGQCFELAVFRDNLEARWGKGLDLLRMVLTISREIGHERSQKFKRRKRVSGSFRPHIVFRLHARACQVAGEILALLEAGFADGAMARWRTLHEIGVVATFIADSGEDVARRYSDHEAIEAKAALDEYERCCGRLGYAAFPKRQARSIRKAYDLAIGRYGKEFASPFGWAANHLKRKKPILSDLEVAIGRDAMRPFYKMASYNVHATATGIFSRLSSLDPRGAVVAGATNAGFTEPGQNAVFSLVQITSLLAGPRWSLDDLIQFRALTALRDEVPSAFMRAERRLRRDDAAVRSGSKTRASARRSRAMRPSK